MLTGFSCPLRSWQLIAFCWNRVEFWNMLLILSTESFQCNFMKSFTLSRMFNPVTPIEDVLKNGSSDNALSLVWAQSATKQQRVHCWCCISAGTITLFSRPQRGRLNWTTPPSHCLNSHHMQHPNPPCFPANQPTRHPLLPCTHPLVSCPYLGRDILSSGLGRGWGRASSWHKGGRRRSSEHSQLFLNKDMSGIQAPLSLKSLSFHSTSLEHTLMSTHSFIEVIGSECFTDRRCSVYDGEAGVLLYFLNYNWQKQNSLLSCLHNIP